MGNEEGHFHVILVAMQEYSEEDAASGTLVPGRFQASPAKVLREKMM